MRYPANEFFLIPNILSLLRLALAVPLFFFFIQPVPPILPTLICSLAVILSDLLDGILARRLDQCSELGRILDPLGDKVIMFAAMIALALAGRITAPLLILLLGKDLLIFAGGLIIARHQKVVVPSNFFGKWASALLGCGFLCYILWPSTPDTTAAFLRWSAFVLLNGGTLFVFLSLAGYTQVFLRQMQPQSPISSTAATLLFAASFTGWVLFTVFHVLRNFAPQLLQIHLL